MTRSSTHRCPLVYFPLAAGVTLTLTWTFVQQHWKPPPPSPDESLACRRRTYSPGVVNMTVVVALPPSAALTVGLAGSNATAAGPRNTLQFRTTGGGPPAPRPRPAPPAAGSVPRAAGSASRGAAGGPGSIRLFGPIGISSSCLVFRLKYPTSTRTLASLSRYQPS